MLLDFHDFAFHVSFLTPKIRELQGPPVNITKLYKCILIVDICSVNLSIIFSVFFTLKDNRLIYDVHMHE